MSPPPPPRALALVALASLAAAHPVPAAVIYNCRTPGSPGSILITADPDESSSFTELPGTPQEREFESRVGDVITFAGTDRFVTAFAPRLAAFNGVGRGYTIDVELSIYTVVSGLPGELLWSGVNPGVIIPPTPTLVAVETVFTPNILLPDTVCFAVGFTSISRADGESRAMGVATYSTPSVGSSPVTTIHQLSADNSWTTQNNSTVAGGLFRHVEARVEAIPAPALSLAVLALPAMVFRRRR